MTQALHGRTFRVGSNDYKIKLVSELLEELLNDGEN